MTKLVAIKFIFSGNGVFRLWYQHAWNQFDFYKNSPYAKATKQVFINDGFHQLAQMYTLTIFAFSFDGFVIFIPL